MRKLLITRDTDQHGEVFIITDHWEGVNVTWGLPIASFRYQDHAEIFAWSLVNSPDYEKCTIENKIP